MFLDSSDFERWMERIMERFDSLENRLEKPDERKKAPTIDGEKLFDNQDICFMLHICKRTLQRYRTLGWLPFLKIDQRAYYKESDVHTFYQGTHAIMLQINLFAVFYQAVLLCIKCSPRTKKHNLSSLD